MDRFGKGQKRAILGVVGPIRLEQSGPVKEQSGPVKVTLLMKIKSGRSLALNHCMFRIQKENVGNRNERQKGNNKRKAVASYRMARHTKLMKKLLLFMIRR